MSTVNLTRQTKLILQNFATINPSIVIKKGSVIKTIAIAENVLAEYEGEEYWPKDFAIYDLGQFLSAINTMWGDQPPILEFLNEDYVNIRNAHGNGVIRYYFSDPEITLKTSPEKSVPWPGTSIEFDLPWDMLESIISISSQMKLDDIQFISSDAKEPVIKMCDRENETSNTAKFNPPLGSSDGSHELSLRIENLKIYSKNVSYKVRVSDQMLSEWVVTDIEGFNDVNLKYYVALEPQK